MKRAVLITGCNGGIGQRLVESFSSEDWFVIGIDRHEDAEATAHADHFISADVANFVSDQEVLPQFGGMVRDRLDGAALTTIINNAAVQHLGRLDQVSTDSIVETMNVNVIAPMLVVREFLPELSVNKGSVINIGSVHAQATKPEFSAYATSKAALHGLTRALAVDLGPDVRVNTLAPAATATPMLKAGFENNRDAFEALQSVHPMRRIAEPEEIAKIALFLASAHAIFLTGATIYADGGILSRLHDPA